MTEFLQQLINGLSLGSVYALLALGYTMVYGILRFINFAHSDVFMIGAFAGFYFGKYFPHQTFGGGIAVTVLAMLVCAVLGMTIERLAYRPLRRRKGSKYSQALDAGDLGRLERRPRLLRKASLRVQQLARSHDDMG